MNIYNLFSKCVTVMFVFQVQVEINYNNDPKIITFSGWNMPEIKMGTNMQVKGGIGTMIEYQLPKADFNPPFDFQFGISDIFKYHGPSINSISCVGKDVLCYMGDQIGTTTSVSVSNRVGIQLFQGKSNFRVG